MGWGERRVSWGASSNPCVCITAPGKQASRQLPDLFDSRIIRGRDPSSCGGRDGRMRAPRPARPAAMNRSIRHCQMQAAAICMAWVAPANSHGVPSCGREGLSPLPQRGASDQGHVVARIKSRALARPNPCRPRQATQVHEVERVCARSEGRRRQSMRTPDQVAWGKPSHDNHLELGGRRKLKRVAWRHTWANRWRSLSCSIEEHRPRCVSRSSSSH